MERNIYMNILEMNILEIYYQKNINIIKNQYKRITIEYIEQGFPSGQRGKT